MEPVVPVDWLPLPEGLGEGGKVGGESLGGEQPRVVEVRDAGVARVAEDEDDLAGVEQARREQGKGQVRLDEARGGEGLHEADGIDVFRVLFLKNKNWSFPYIFCQLRECFFKIPYVFWHEVGLFRVGEELQLQEREALVQRHLCAIAAAAAAAVCHLPDHLLRPRGATLGIRHHPKVVRSVKSILFYSILLFSTGKCVTFLICML